MLKKHGISLIVLSITILVMAILAATAIIALEDTGIIGRSKNTVNKQNVQEEYTRLQVVKNGILTDNLGTITVEEYVEELKEKGIIEETVTIDEYDSTVVKTKSGLDVYIRQDGDSNINISFEQIVVVMPPTLGSLISKDNYGDTVDYSVTVDGTTYSDWQIYYHNADYVYLIAAESVANVSLDKGTTVASLTTEEKSLYEKFRVGTADKYTLADTVNGNQSYNSQAVAQLIKDYANFANTTDYDSNIVGAIGGPTVELLVAGWNAKGYSPTFILTTNAYGYEINGESSVMGVASDGLYLLSSDTYYWYASPSSANIDAIMDMSMGDIHYCSYQGSIWVRPVVCLKSSIPAEVGTGTYDFELVK